MPIRLSIQVPANAVNGIRDRLLQSISTSREHMVQTVTESALTRIADTVPVVTGETRGEWLSELSRTEGTLPSSSSPHQSVQSATNRVAQMIYLEYGTTSMAPRSTVRTTLPSLQSRISAFFRFGG